MTDEGRGRAPNLRSSIYFSDSDGLWHGWVTMGVKSDGRPDRRHRKAQTEAEVTQKVQALEADRDAGRVTKTGRTPTVEQWFERWLTRVVSREVDENTLTTSYEPTVRRHIIPGLGRHRIDNVLPDHIEDFYERLADEKGLAQSTILKVHWRLMAGFQVATDRDLIKRNPVSLVKPPSSEAVAEGEPLGREEARVLLRACRGRRMGIRWSLALTLGIRQSEALGLRWPYLKAACDPCRVVYDLQDLFATDAKGCPACSGQLHYEARVEWQLKHRPFRHGCEDIAACTKGRHLIACPTGCKGHHKPKCEPGCTARYHQCPKRPCPTACEGHGRECPDRVGGDYYFGRRKASGKGKGKQRLVLPIPPPLVTELRVHWQMQRHEADLAGENWEGATWDLVFASPAGGPIGKHTDWEDWKRLLAVAGVRDVRVHDGRHTAATILTELGADARTVQEILGHSQISQTERYIHVSSDQARAAIGKMSTLFDE
ncbi:tyrosine-type recombinase/integrase [Spiractinospora alimapuensis]|uniref:tyrosine-type recombinase/integrase n=1 Tax=Spiractinospora alimapuensis TaxID=2820884 RepID=UPI001F22B418|nr:tyrosine-type recombinase/integrase [Spiractinospora alimapuensis]QVQ51332.1 tyrosine-type recombinase/integrase [Spiractinospora alimapuensis]